MIHVLNFFIYLIPLIKEELISDHAFIHCAILFTRVTPLIRMKMLFNLIMCIHKMIEGHIHAR